MIVCGLSNEQLAARARELAIESRVIQRERLRRALAALDDAETDDEPEPAAAAAPQPEPEPDETDDDETDDESEPGAAAAPQADGEESDPKLAPAPAPAPHPKRARLSFEARTVTELNAKASRIMGARELCGETGGSSGVEKTVRFSGVVIDYAPLEKFIAEEAFPRLAAVFPATFAGGSVARPRVEEGVLYDVNRRDVVRGRAGAKPKCVVCDERIEDGDDSYFVARTKGAAPHPKRHMICHAVKLAFRRVG